MSCVAHTRTHTHVCLRFLNSWMKTVATMPWVHTTCQALYHCFAGLMPSATQVLAVTRIMTLILQMRNFKFQRGSNFFSFTQLVILGKVRIQTRVFLFLELEFFLTSYCLKASNMFKHTLMWACPHTCCPTPSHIPTHSEDWGPFSALWSYSLGIGSWYWKPKWRTFRDLEVFSVEWLPFLSWAELTKRPMHSRATWVSRTAPPMVCRDWPQTRFLDTRDLQSARALPGYLLICGSPFSWSCPHSLLRKRLFTIEHPVGRMLPQCFDKMCLFWSGWRAICLEIFVVFLIVSFTAPTPNSNRASCSVFEDWVCSPWTTDRSGLWPLSS